MINNIQYLKLLFTCFFFRLNLITKELWESESTSMMTIARRYPGTIVLDDRLYVIGGSSGKTVLNSTECFSIKDKKWSSCAALLDGVIYMGVEE